MKINFPGPLVFWFLDSAANFFHKSSRLKREYNEQIEHDLLFLFVGTIVFILGLVFKFVTDNPLTSLIPSGTALAALLLARAYRRIEIKPIAVSK